MSRALKYLIFGLFCFVSASAQAKGLPLWELGAGLITFKANHYRGSNQYQEFFIPAPYFIYRGDKLQAENSFIQGRFLKAKNVSLNLSLSAGLPIKSGKNHAREGMPDINFTVETGTLLSVVLAKEKRGLHGLTFHWPFRAATATDFKKFQHIGFISSPHLSFSIHPHKRTFGLTLEFSVGPIFATRKYHDYFYGVPEQFVTPGRGYFKPSGGYSGSQMFLIMSRRFGDVLVLPFIRYDILSKAEFAESPLVRKKNYLFAGLGFSWFFKHSKEEQKNRALR